MVKTLQLFECNFVSNFFAAGRNRKELQRKNGHAFHFFGLSCRTFWFIGGLLWGKLHIITNKVRKNLYEYPRIMKPVQTSLHAGQDNCHKGTKAFSS